MHYNDKKWNAKDPEVPFIRNWHREDDGPPEERVIKGWHGEPDRTYVYQPTKVVLDEGYQKMETYPEGYGLEFVRFDGLFGVSLTLRHQTRGRSAATSWWEDEATGIQYPISYTGLELLLKHHTIRRGVTEAIDWKPSKKGANYYLDPAVPK